MQDYVPQSKTFLVKFKCKMFSSKETVIEPLDAEFDPFVEYSPKFEYYKEEVKKILYLG